MAEYRIDATAVPAVMRRVLYAFLIGAGIVSIPFIGAFGPAPTTVFLDAWMILFILFSLARRRILTTALLLFLAAYFLTRVIPALATLSPLGDFLQAYRWVVYLIVFAFALGRRWGPVEPLIKVMWGLLAMATLKAGLTFVIIGPGERPGLLVENNFELALFSGLVAVLYKHMPRSRVWAVALLGLLTILSGSRSGAVVFLVLAIYAITQARNLNMFYRYLLVLAVPALTLVPVYIFAERVQGLSSRLDRLKFLDVFLSETSSWDWSTWLVGTTPITQLSPGACESLSFYGSLFSSTGDGTCYSVILHAFLLRVVFDAGLIGLIISIAVPWYLLRRAGVPRLLASCLLLIALTNGLSVSGLNNPYVALPILLALLPATTSGTTSHPGPRPRYVGNTPGIGNDSHI